MLDQGLGFESSPPPQCDLNWGTHRPFREGKFLSKRPVYSHPKQKDAHKKDRVRPLLDKRSLALLQKRRCAIYTLDTNPPH